MKIIDEYCFFKDLESCLKDARTYRNREKMSDWEKEYRATVIEETLDYVIDALVAPWKIIVTQHLTVL